MLLHLGAVGVGLLCTTSSCLIKVHWKRTCCPLKRRWVSTHHWRTCRRWWSTTSLRGCWQKRCKSSHTVQSLSPDACSLTCGLLGVWRCCETSEECWDHEAEARLSAGCVGERTARPEEAVTVVTMATNVGYQPKASGL